MTTPRLISLRGGDLVVYQPVTKRDHPTPEPRRGLVTEIEHGKCRARVRPCYARACDVADERLCDANFIKNAIAVHGGRILKRFGRLA